MKKIRVFKAIKKNGDVVFIKIDSITFIVELKNGNLIIGIGETYIEIIEKCCVYETDSILEY